MSKICSAALSGCLLFLMSLPLPVAAQGDVPISLGDGGLVEPRNGKRHDPAQAVRQSVSTAPRPSAIAPLTSRFILNGTTLEHGASGFAAVTGLNGNKRNGMLSFSATYGFGNSLKEGVQNNLFRRRQSGWYLQYNNVERKRTITTTREETVDVLGTRIMLSVTGGCIAPGSASGSLCTYTPGVAVDTASIDPDTLVPGRFVFSSQFSQEISRDTHQALQAPGFQRGVEGGTEVVGMDLLLPNTGATAPAGPAGKSSINRVEKVKSRPMVTLSRVEQNLYSNDRAASLDRTIRGFVLLEDDEWTDRALAFQAAAWLLPAFSAELNAGSSRPNLRISNNLFMSANNLRLPRDSHTVYQSSRAWVPHGDAPARRASETPVAWAHGLWLGFSPVRDVRRSERLKITPTAARATLDSSFAQGGYNDSFGELIDGTITVIDQIDNQITELEFSNIGDLFVQSGTELTSQAAIRRITSQEEWRYRYIPHLSLTGDRTSGTSVLRYYGGALFDDEPNVYAGFDVSHYSETGWSAYFRADGYTRPNRDYYSAVEGRLSRDITLSENRRLSVGVAANAALGRPDAKGEEIRFSEDSNTLDLMAQYYKGATSYSFRQRFSNLDSDDHGASTGFGFTHELTPHLALRGQVVPLSTEKSFIRAQAGLTLSVDDKENPPSFGMQWARIEYDYGRDIVGRKLDTSENVFFATFRMPL